MARITRRTVLIGAAAALTMGAVGAYFARRRSAPIGFTLSSDELAQARALLAGMPAIDMHAHPGRSFVHQAEHLSTRLSLYALRGSFETATIADMRAGGLATSVFAAVSDFQVLDLVDNGLKTIREFAPGEALASYRRQIARFKSLVDDGLVYPVLAAADVEAARRGNRAGAIFSVEGGDFLEGKPERVAAAFADGVRTITLMHYRGNELGDIMTELPRHGGLTPAGIAVVQEMNRLGMVIDVAHATEASVRGVLAHTGKPIMASHTHLHGAAEKSHPRFISRDLARAIASAGGVVGAWPAGIGISDLNGFLGRIIELVDALGIEHVGLGTDMDANYQPVLDNYLKLPWLVGGLLRRGLSKPDIARIMGGNFLRVFAANQVS